MTLMPWRTVVIPVLVLVTLFLCTPMAVGESRLLGYSYVKSIDVYAPAVSGSGQGVLSKTTLIVAYPGNGRVFFSALPYTELDTQGAARIAAYVASLIAGVPFDEFDYYVVTESSTPIIGGPSSGGLMTIGFLSLLTNRSLQPWVTMTGMINPDGTIGPVGGLKEKLDAAASNGFKMFLIPFGQRQYQYPVIQETRLPWGVVRRVVYKSIDLVEYGRSINVSVIEVKSVFDAFTYFTGVNISGSTYAQLQYNVPSGVVDSLLGELTTLISDAFSKAEDVRNPFYKGSLLTALSSLNTTLSTLYSAKDTRPAYVFMKGLDLYSGAMYYGLLADVLSNKLSVDMVVNTVNLTLLRVGEEFGKVGVFRGLDSVLWLSLARAIYYRAGYYYANALSSSSDSEKLMYLAHTLSYARQAEAFLNMSSISVNESATLTRVSMNTRSLYALSSTVYSYVSALINEVGGNTQALNDASDYYTLLNSQVASDNLTMLGFTVYSIGESLYALHQAFEQNSLESVASVQSSISVNLCHGVDRYSTIGFFREYGLEAMGIGDYSSAVEAFSMGISMCMVVRLALSAGNISVLTTPPQEVSVSTPSMEWGGGSTNNTSGSSGSANTMLVKYLAIVGAMLAIVSIVLALRILRTPGPRGDAAGGLFLDKGFKPV